MLIIFVATVFLSAALLFVVEPMSARMVLPLLGGSPAVWNTALVFFQVTLVAGYGYVHWSTTRLGARGQTLLHFVLLGAAMLVLPIGMPRGWTPPVERNPAPWLLGVMTVTLGLPFLAVSTTGPLMQKWLAVTRHRLAPDPYFLYAASNLGSLVGLLCYPALLEPHLRLADQSRLWMWGYGLLVALTLVCAWMMRRFAAPAPLARAPDPPGGAMAPPDVRRRIRWILLAFAPSSLMMAVTTHITTDIAAVPLLWVVPLAIYLLTFILVFARRAVIPHVAAVWSLPFLVLPLLIVIVGRPAQPIVPIMGFHLLVLFVAALVCHGELARDRPGTEHLTAFYLWLAVGGALGGVFNALVAPRIFRSVAEYPIALVLACLLAPPRRPIGPGLRARVLDVALPAVVAAIPLLIVGWFRSHRVPFDRAFEVLLVAILVFPVFSFRRRPVRFGLGVGALLLANPAELGMHARMLHSERSFFGIHRVVVDGTGGFHQLLHGTTLHGVQRVRPRLCREPAGYYGRGGPLGEVFRALPQRNDRAVAVAGLGAGAAAAYAGAGERWTFFEIDPVVRRIACDPRWFCYLEECPADFSVVLGDARLSLAGSRGRFDLILLDAYSSDAIPVHLLTREALRVYLDRLAPGGIIAFHLSNKFFDLVPVVSRLALDAGLVCRVRDSGTLNDQALSEGLLPSLYAVVARRGADLGALASDAAWTTPSGGGSNLWTDDFSSLFSVLRR
jgi:hypothetical protein